MVRKVEKIKRDYIRPFNFSSADYLYIFFTFLVLFFEKKLNVKFKLYANSHL
jgi:hypothetical protein